MKTKFDHIIQSLMFVNLDVINGLEASNDQKDIASLAEALRMISDAAKILQKINGIPVEESKNQIDSQVLRRGHINSMEVDCCTV